MMIALYRSVPVREGKGRSGTGRYEMVPGGTNGRVGAGSIEPWSLEGQNVKSVKTWNGERWAKGGAFMVSTTVNRCQPGSAIRRNLIGPE